ncbi:MAG: hypothetical protein ABJC63_16095, partial [Gemmatimonadales bacterium]
MKTKLILALSAAVVGLACRDSASARAGATSGAAKPPTQTTAAADLRRDSIKLDSIARAKIVHVPRPAIVRGLYVNRWAALGRKMGELIGIAKTTEVNALVIDVKD